MIGLKMMGWNQHCRMIDKKLRAGTDIFNSSSHFPMIGAQLCNSRPLHARLWAQVEPLCPDDHWGEPLHRCLSKNLRLAGHCEQIENGIGGQGGILRQMGKGGVPITPKAKKVFQVQA